MKTLKQRARNNIGRLVAICCAAALLLCACGVNGADGNGDGVDAIYTAAGAQPALGAVPQQGGGADAANTGTGTDAGDALKLSQVSAAGGANSPNSASGASDGAAGDTAASAGNAAASAADAAPQVPDLTAGELARLTILSLDSSLAMIDGKATDLVEDQPALYPYLRGEKTYVPLEYVEKGLGAEASHNETKGMLHIRRDGETVLTLNSAEYDYTLGSTGDYALYVPLRRAAEALGKSVAYFDGLVMLCDGPAPADINPAQLAELKKTLTGATSVGSAEKLDKLLAGTETGYYGAYDNYLLQSRRNARYGNDLYYPMGDIDGVDIGSVAAVAGEADGADTGGSDMGAPATAAAAPSPASREEAGMASGSAQAAGGGSGSARASGTTAATAGVTIAAAAATMPATTAAENDTAPVPAPTNAPTNAPAGTTAAAASADMDSAAALSDAEAAKTGDGEYSATNVQVEGVDESDVVKTDGRYIYQVNGRRILIVDAYPPSGMKISGKIEYTDNNTSSYGYASEDGVSLQPLEMYVDGDIMTIIGHSERHPEPAPPRTYAESETDADGVTRDRVYTNGAPAATDVEAAANADVEAVDTAAVEKAAIEAAMAAASTTAAPAATAAPATAPSVPVTTTAPATTAAAPAMPAADMAVIDAETSMAYSDPYYFGGWTPTTRVLIYDIKDRAAPKLVRDTEVEGGYASSRKIGGALYLVVNKPLHYYAPMNRIPYETGVAARGDVYAVETTKVAYRDSATASGEFTDLDYSRMYYFPGCVSRNYLVVAGIDTRDAAKPVSVHSVLDYGNNVYASAEYLYVAAQSYRARYWDDMNYNETTAVHRFKLNGGDIVYDGKGEVKGSVLNQFSMDESGGYFRIATTSSYYNNRDGYVSENNLYILDGALKVAGSLEGLAPGEQIYSARFIGARGYIVTFKTVDPLFVIDLSDPTNPTVLGSLKIPGYSDYLHPYDENHIIGFGKDTFEYSGTALYQGMKIALFDVTDVANPIELFKTAIGDRGTESPLLYDHRALLFSKERGLLAFPVTVMTIPESQKTGDRVDDAFTYGQFEFQGAYVYDLNLTDGFTLKGRVTHISDEGYRMYGSDYWGQNGDDVGRLLYIRDTLYALSQRFITAHDIGDPATETGRVELN